MPPGGLGCGVSPPVAILVIDSNKVVVEETGRVRDIGLGEILLISGGGCNRPSVSEVRMLYSVLIMLMPTH